MNEILKDDARLAWPELQKSLKQVQVELKEMAKS